MLYPYPGGLCGTGVQHVQKFRVRVWCPTEVTDVLCRVIPAVNTPGMVLCVPYRQNENRKFGYGCYKA